MGFPAATGRTFIECMRDLGATALSITHDPAAGEDAADGAATAV